MTSISAQPWGTTPTGDEITLYTLTDGDKIKVEIINYGARIVSIVVPDKNGAPADIVLGFDDLEGYLGDNPHFGAVIGRYANRIAGGRFHLNGRDYQLHVPNGVSSLHGGKVGFDRRVWTPRMVPIGGSANNPGLELSYTSVDGEEGYPGALDVIIVYSLVIMEGAPALRTEYTATAVNQDTIVNLSNHSYFDLAGEGSRTILNNTLMINAAHYTRADMNSLPTGVIAPVEGTPFDFRQPQVIGERLEHFASDESIHANNGYDVNMVLDGGVGGAASFENPPLAARLSEPTSGRTLEVYTNQPGMQFYTSNFLNASIRGKHGHEYPRHSAVCLETQHFPDSPNHPNFPTTVVRAGQTQRFVTVWRFGR